MSTSQPGLQRCLDKLNSYCANNCLTVNLKKTKVVVFSKSGRLTSDKFFYDSIEIEKSTSYKYLGIVFSASGTFSYCQKDLYNRALRAQFKLTKCFFSMTPKLDSLLHLFEHTIEPVLLYGSEIWGTVNILSSKIKKADFKLENLVENLLCDKLQLKFLKYISRMHKKAPNMGVLSEFGRYPLYINVLVNTCKYLHRLLTSASDLLHCTFKESCDISKRKKMSWVACVEFVLKQVGVSTSQASLPSFPYVVKSKLVNRFKINLTTHLAECNETKQGKLRTYASFKTNFKKEKYLSVINNVDIRKCFMAFRISAHKLEIEVGRYKNIQSMNRLCKVCKSNEVEDEKHFIFSCNKYSLLRKEFFNKISDLCRNFSALSQDSKLFWLMNNESTEVILLLSKYIYDCFQLRNA